MTDATPRPWRHKKHGGRYRIVDSAQELTIAYVPIEHMNKAEANAALIVRAVNAHDDLVKALRLVERQLPKNADAAAYVQGTADFHGDEIIQIRAALAKAGAP